MGGPLPRPRPRDALPAHRPPLRRDAEEGALEEVAALAERRLDPALPVMRAHGVRHLIAHIEGRLSLAEAADGQARHPPLRQAPVHLGAASVGGLRLGRAGGGGRDGNARARRRLDLGCAASAAAAFHGPFQPRPRERFSLKIWGIDNRSRRRPAPARLSAKL